MSGNNENKFHGHVEIIGIMTIDGGTAFGAFIRCDRESITDKEGMRNLWGQDVVVIAGEAKHEAA